MNYSKNPLWLGVGWPQDLSVEGAEPGDRFRVSFRRQSDASAAFTLPDIASTSDGIVRIRLDGSVTASWLPGIYQWQVALIRGNGAAIFAGLPPIVAERPLALPLVEDDPLGGPNGEAIELTLRSSGSSVVLKLVKGVSGDKGKDGEPGRDAVGGSGASHLHVQANADLEWLVEHGLGFRPHVSVTDTSGGLVDGDVEHLSLTVIRLRFSAPFAGEARFS